MARRHRFRIANLSQHLIQRGNNRLEIFRREEDCEVFAAFLRAASSRHQVEIHSYVLMTTHFHLLVTPRMPSGVERMMHSVGFRYARHFNQKYQRTGALFEGRYRATIIDNAVYWYSCMRYVELNPVRAGVVSTPDAYYWCSYLANACGQPDPLLTPHPLYLELGEAAEDRQRCWRTMCAQGVPVDELDRLRAAVHGGGALGAVVIEAT